MQPPCFLLKRYLEVNPAFYRTSPLSFLVTPPVTFSHWLLALAASFDASCRLNHTTPPVVPQPLFSTASWCLPLPLCPHRLLVLLLPSVPRRLLVPWSPEIANSRTNRLPTPPLPTSPVLSASAPHPFLPIPSARPLFVQSCSSR